MKIKNNKLQKPKWKLNSCQAPKKKTIFKPNKETITENINVS